MPRVTLKSRLPEIAAEIRPRVSAAMKEGAELVAAEARERVATGPPPEHIKEHIEVARHEAAGYYVAATATDEKGRPYAHWHEFGTTKAPPYPFLVPALEANVHNIERLAAGSLKRL